MTVLLVEQQGRGHKGVALALRYTFNYKREATAVTTNTMYVTVRIKNLYLTVLNTALQTLRSELMETLNQIRRRHRRPSIIIGDLNARHKNWDTSFNTAGTTLLRWTNLHNWMIRAANLPHFTAFKGYSNIDLFITKAIRVTEAYRQH